MTLLPFLSGAVTMGFMIAALFFLRFWRNTRDGLFLAFALAFFLLGVVQGLLALGGVPREHSSWIYLIRLAAFVVILGAVIRKNLAAR
jgi:hypothetical protein